ncbi:MULTISPECIES: glycosyltransferase family 2 protein [unclassified Shinella]|uniref:glycosyltransferase family 2 protein n=1 Tax=unclassified Shinella TaxID=2643062 RepID=UPI00234F5AE5|nr:MULTISPECIES: glycosyltransferase family 2 protein [unclassified Shinella]MCO5151451.1 glycosyltransferase [Shinella sp.]MDC7266058.1 glycosyltransferase [Shinella sp. HY16]MDC7272955.1 glycosyltransferase [Shinella sp. YZ44]
MKRRQRGRSRSRDVPLMVPVFTGWQRVGFLVGMGLWIVALGVFWIWWLQPAHHASWMGSIVVTGILAWGTLLPAYFVFLSFRACRPNGPLRLPRGSRVAMVVTKAPSEPFSLLAETLSAMLAQEVPHDTWLADEDPTPETLEWCRRNGVFVSTRKGREEYHRKVWPRRTRCKEGNLAFFYDQYGYDRYDFVVQLDADHVPAPGYLFEMLRPFADAGVGYVSAPSICSRNAAGSWAARGRLYAEACMHGALQAGYNNGFAPLCFGSHYAVRTRALKEIGGLGPELAEDHSTTMMMNAHGWRGVHALDAIAYGDGPSTFADLVTQEFQWSRSLMMILLQYSPKLCRTLPFRLRFQFMFAQFWYPLLSLFMALMFLLPIVALVTGINFVTVTYLDFLGHYLPQAALLILLAYGWRASRTFRPHDAKVLSFEVTLFLFARWPWALAGTLAALRDWSTGSFVDFRITPKGVSEVDPLPLRVLAPYAFMAIASILPVLLIPEANDSSRGFYIFAIMNAAIYTALLVVVVVQHARENRVRYPARSYRPVMAASLAALVALPCFAAAERGRDGIESLAWGTESFALFENRFSVSGAGVGGHDVHRTIFNPHWRVLRPVVVKGNRRL